MWEEVMRKKERSFNIWVLFPKKKYSKLQNMISPITLLCYSELWMNELMTEKGRYRAARAAKKIGVCIFIVRKSNNTYCEKYKFRLIKHRLCQSIFIFCEKGKWASLQWKSLAWRTKNFTRWADDADCKRKVKLKISLIVWIHPHPPPPHPHTQWVSPTSCW